MNPKPETRAHILLATAVLGIALVLISGLGLAIHFAIMDTSAVGPVDDRDVAVGGVSRRDLIAAAPMLTTDPAAARGGIPALGQPPIIVVPHATEVGPEGLPAGYPQTPEGAAGQLAQILWSTLGSMDLAHAQRVQQAWFQQPDADGRVWPVLGLIQEFGRAGGTVDGLPAGATMAVVPVAAQIKGSDGPGWHVACVLVQLTYTFREQAAMAYGHCERMIWTTDLRWLIAAGTHPVPAPSTWPGTELALQAGWQTWVEE